MDANGFAPLFGVSMGLLLALAALSMFMLLVWGLVPFALLNIRRQVQEQLVVLQRIERHLSGEGRAEPPATPSAPQPPNLPT